jgi:hypothetical protein
VDMASGSRWPLQAIVKITTIFTRHGACASFAL